MGCISSKLLAKPGNFSETVSQSFQRRTNNVHALQELLISSSESNNDQQFLALLFSTNTATSIKPNGSELTQLSKDPNPTPSPDPTKVETINSWELLAGLEEENEEKETDNHEVKNAEQNVEGAISGKARSFRTVEELDVILTSSDSEDSNNFVIEDSSGSSDTSNSSNSSGAKRKTRARELAALELPAFEFGKSGSLRDWLLKGGQVFSPGSYVTPKFGSSVQKEEIVNNNSNDEELVGGGSVFDPEMLAQFEDAIEEMRREEESILNGIVERLAGNEEQERPIMSIGKEYIELNCQGNNGFIGGVLV